MGLNLNINANMKKKWKEYILGYATPTPLTLLPENPTNSNSFRIRDGSCEIIYNKRNLGIQVSSQLPGEFTATRWVHSYQVSSQLPYGTKMGKIAAVLGFTDWATTDNKVEIKVVTSFITFYMLEKLSFLSRDANGVSFSGGFMALPQHGCCFTINGSRYVTVVV